MGDSKGDQSTSQGRVDGIEHFKIPMLREENYSLWRRMILDLMSIKGLSLVFNNEKDASDIDIKKAKLTILGNMEPKQALHIQHCSSPKEMILTLDAIYDDKCKANGGRLLKKFFCLQLDPKESMSVHMSKMEFLRNELKANQQPISDDIFIMQLLSTLPPAYDNMKDIWESTDPARKTVGELKSRILSREEDLGQQSEGNALAARGKFGGGKFESIEDRKKRTKCAKCGQKGHWAKECEAEPDDYVQRGNAKLAKSENDKSVSF